MQGFAYVTSSLPHRESGKERIAIYSSGSQVQMKLFSPDAFHTQHLKQSTPVETNLLVKDCPPTSSTTVEVLGSLRCTRCLVDRVQLPVSARVSCHGGSYSAYGVYWCGRQLLRSMKQVIRQTNLEST